MVRANASPGLQLTSERALGPIPLIRRTCVDNPLFKRDTISLFTYFWGPYPCQQTRAPYDEDGECEDDIRSGTEGFESAATSQRTSPLLVPDKKQTGVSGAPVECQTPVWFCLHGVVGHQTETRPSPVSFLHLTFRPEWRMILVSSCVTTSLRRLVTPASVSRELKQ